MKNLKKVLALVLVVAMMASFAVTAGAANFTDGRDIDNNEAVEVMSAIGVIDGFADGSFKPDNTLTREQAAKILTYMLMGKTQADKLVATVAPYADVAADRWSAGAIAYCTNEGILSGVGNGRFNPSGELTGLQFAKMLLVALGYDPDIEKLTGSSWAVNTASLALDADLDDKIGGTMSGALSRQDAAQMAFNTLKADMVEYDSTTNVSVNGAAVVVGNSKAKAVTTKKDWGANIKDDKADNEYTVQFAEKYLQDLEAKDEADDFGREATKWTWKNKEIGKYSDKADFTYTAKVTKKALYSDLGKSVYDDLTASKDPTTFDVTVDGEPVSDPDPKDYLDKNSTAKIGSSLTGNGVLTEVYVDDDNNVDIIVINTYVMQATGDYNASKEEVKVDFPENATSKSLAAGEKTLSADDFNVADLKEDDYILVTIAGNEIKSVKPATVVSGTVSSYSTGNNVTIDGTTYKYTNNIDSSADNGKGVSYSVNDEAKVVLDEYGYIIYVDEAKVSSDKYVFLNAFDEDGKLNSKNVIADAFFLDGTRQTITINNDDDYDKDTTAGWFTYSEKKSGKYEIEAIKTENAKTATAASGKKLTENGKITVGTDTTFKANKSTIFVVLDEDDNIKVYEGISKVPTLTANDKSGELTAYARMDGTYAKNVFIDASDANVKNANKASTDYVYLLKHDEAGTDSNENDYYQYKAIVNGETTTIRLDDSFNDKQKLNVLFEEIEYDAETGYVSDMTEVKADDKDYVVGTLTGAEIKYSNGVVSFADDNVLADEYKIYMVVKAGVDGINDNDSDYTVNEVTGKGLQTDCDGYTVDGTFYGVLNDDDEISTLYVYISDATAA